MPPPPLAAMQLAAPASPLPLAHPAGRRIRSPALAPTVAFFSGSSPLHLLPPSFLQHIQQRKKKISPLLCWPSHRAASSQPSSRVLVSRINLAVALCSELSIKTHREDSAVASCVPIFVYGTVCAR